MLKRADGAGTMPQGEAPVPAKPDKEKTEKTKKSVYIYIAILFLVVVLFTLLSYFVQQRNNSEISTLNAKNATAQQNIENLQHSNLQLQSDNDADKKQISGLQGQVTDLENQLKKMQEQWQADVANDQTAYNELLAKYNALIQQDGDKGGNE